MLRAPRSVGAGSYSTSSAPQLRPRRGRPSIRCLSPLWHRRRPARIRAALSWPPFNSALRVRGNPAHDCRDRIADPDASRESARASPTNFRSGHLDEPEKKLIVKLLGGKPDQPLLRSRDAWRTSRSATLRRHLGGGKPRLSPARRISDADGRFHRKEKDADRLNLGVPGDARRHGSTSMRRTLDFQLKQLAYRACAGRSFEGVRLVGGALAVSPLESEVPRSLPRRLNGSSTASCPTSTLITDLLTEVDGWTGFTGQIHTSAHRRHGAQSPRHSGRRAGRRHQSGSQAHGGSLIQCQRTTALVGRVCFTIRPETYRAAQASDHRRPFSPSARCSLGR